MLKALLRGLSNVVFPPSCVHCQGLVEEGTFRHLCACCAAQVEFAPASDDGCAAVLFRGPARALVIELKYRRGLYVLPDIEELFRRAPTVLTRARGATLVPVPLHPRKQRERGFNQSLLLARILAKAAGGDVPVAPLLRRVADTPTQTALDRESRQSNLKNAFALARGADFDCRLRYLLVDDVFTTGSTLASCARALRLAGGLSIDTVAFATG